MNNANYVPYSYLSAYYDKMSVLIYDAILLCTPKTSVKFLISFVSPIFPPQGLSFWHQPLSCRCKGMAAGFGNKRSSLRFSKKSPHRWVVFFRKTLYFQPRRPWKAPETKRPMRQEDAKKMSEKGAIKRWRNEKFPSAPGTANKFNSRLYDN